MLEQSENGEYEEKRDVNSYKRRTNGISMQISMLDSGAKQELGIRHKFGIQNQAWQSRDKHEGDAKDCKKVGMMADELHKRNLGKKRFEEMPVCDR